MIRCNKCVMPDTRPYISFDSNGICSACNNKKEEIDWNNRKIIFELLIKKIKSFNNKYDIVVPVSGGKDSHVQVKKCIEYGLKVLAVNIDYGIKTDIGIYNLNLISSLGADLIVYKPNEIENKNLIRIGLEDYGDNDLLTHPLLYCTPIHIAGNFKIPFVMFGENPAFEYVGDNDVEDYTNITDSFFKKYISNKGITKEIIEEKYNIKISDFYSLPQKTNFTVSTLFMGNYFKWNSEENLIEAQKTGFKTLKKKKIGTYRNYVGIDEYFNEIHQYLKFLKYGYGRCTDHACEDIRNGKITREEGLKLVKKYDGQVPKKAIEECSKYLDYSVVDFIDILNKWRYKC